nr:reverse transcriptase domain-containing protein [Tanacetum cinerariifolium]
MATDGNGDPPVPDLRTMEELCQPSLNGRGGSIASIFIQETNFGLMNDMIQHVQNSCQFHGLLGDDANKHLDKFLHVTQSIKVNGVTDDAICLYLFPHSLTHHATIDTFYNGLTLRHRDTINAATGGTFMKRCPEECYDLIENMTAHHNDWDTLAQRSESSSSITSSYDPKIVALKAEIAEINKNLMKPPLAKPRTYMLREPIIKVVIPTNLKMNTASSSGSGTLPSKTITNPKKDLKGITTRSGTAYQGPTIPTTSSSLLKVVEHETKVTKDMPVVAPVIEPVVAPVIKPVVAPISALKPNQKQSIPYPSRLHDQKLRDKANDQKEKFFQIFQDLNFNISFVDALILMPKFGPTIKSLLTNKDKLFKLARTPLNEHCSAVLLKKLLEKLGDPDKFLILCDFPGIDECLALADLDASINLMPLSVWNKHSLLELSPTCMTLKLADRLISRPVEVAKDVSVKVETFHFSVDFMVVDFDTDPRVSLILKRLFLKTEKSLIDVYEGELTLCVVKEAITFNLNQTSRYSASYNDMTANQIDVIDMDCEEYSLKVLGFFDVIASGNPTPYYDSIVSTSSPTLTPFGDYLPQIQKDLKICEAKNDKSLIDEPPEAELKVLPPQLEYAFLEGDDKFPVIIAKYLKDEEKTALIKVLKSHNPWVSLVHYIPKKGGFTIVENEENELIPTRLVTGWHVCIDYRKLNEATRKDHFPLPFMDQILERLAGNEYYCFLDGFLGYFQIPIDPKDQEKTTFMYPYGTFAYRCMPFGLCNAPGTFQRCMMATFHDMIEKTVEVFMDDFSVFRNSFGTCLSHLEKMLKWCEDTKLCPNWEKTHFMVKEGIILGHKISKNEIEVDKAKLDGVDFMGPFSSLRGNIYILVAVDYLLKWVEAKVFPTNDARVVCKFLKSLFARSGTPHAIISDRGTHYCNDQFAKVMLKYGVTHRLAIAYHPQTSGQVEVSNHSLKRILERTVDENSYENSLIYKEKTKRLHDSKIKDRILNVGDRVLLFNSRLKIFFGKLKTHWSGPFTITQVFPYGTVELSQTDGSNFKVNVHRLKHYFGEDILKMVVPDLQTFLKDQ